VPSDEIDVLGLVHVPDVVVIIEKFLMDAENDDVLFV
jgi:hypothetical protein